MISCKDLLIAKKIDMTVLSIMESISHLGKMARTSAKSENPGRYAHAANEVTLGANGF